ncbi:MAG: RecX family transcriptional regulator [Rhodospirillales bacterium]|jgi:regulatory protein|nr:RecX family transcriptional regulator [Rhodospirillales bacterium]
MTEPDGQNPTKPARPGPRKVTPTYLENAALFYLQRFATSSENLRRVLMRKVERSARFHGTDPAEGARWVDALIARFLASRLLDDALYAESRATSLRRRGASRRTIALSLRQKGVEGEIIEGALAAADETEEAPELAAAARLARKRRLGPYRPPESRRDHRERDLAALARAGFSYDVALAVIDADGPDDA